MHVITRRMWLETREAVFRKRQLSYNAWWSLAKKRSLRKLAKHCLDNGYDNAHTAHSDALEAMMHASMRCRSCNRFGYTGVITHAYRNGVRSSVDALCFTCVKELQRCLSNT